MTHKTKPEKKELCPKTPEGLGYKLPHLLSAGFCYWCNKPLTKEAEEIITKPTSLMEEIEREFYTKYCHPNKLFGKSFTFWAKTEPEQVMKFIRSSILKAVKQAFERVRVEKKTHLKETSGCTLCLFNEALTEIEKKQRDYIKSLSET